ncbi:MAG: carboxypeptidase regulatory-like domain-containing protein, partial [Deltaproteobacteria bacterium]
AERVIPPPAPRPQLAAPAIQLAKRVEIRAARSLAPGALEGTVLDAATNAGIAGAELTFSYDNGAWSTATGPGGAFRFAPRATGMYRLVSIEARGYASFGGEFGSSPVAFTRTEGKDVSGVVLRL